MSHKKAKQIRRYVKNTYPFMSAEPLYAYDLFGCIRLAEVCQRAFVQNIKRNIRRNRGTTSNG